MSATARLGVPVALAKGQGSTKAELSVKVPDEE
jgi:hypothetical protein